MRLNEIEDAVAKLSPDELADFRRWFQEFEQRKKSEETVSSQLPSRDDVRKLRGSLKGMGIMKAFIKERRKEQSQL